MSWEHGLMKEHALIACHNRGDVLEIGYGMGIAANYIQSMSPVSHTIVESHGQVLHRLRPWAAQRDSVILVEGEWYQIRHQLRKYDGVFFDTFNDDEYKRFGECAFDLVKPGGLITFWNSEPGPRNVYGLPATYKRIEINPPKNTYFNFSTYFVPKVRSKS